MRLEIGPYRGDGDDLAGLIVATWNATYRGREWYPVWDAAYVRWRLLDPRVLDRELLVSAYDDGRLVACLLGEQTELRVGTSVVPGSLTSYLSVAPGTRHRGLAMRLLERQRQIHRTRGLQLSVGMSNSRPDAEAGRFWAGMIRRNPRETAVVGRHTLWAMVVDGAAVARAGLAPYERWGPRLGRWVPWGWVGARGTPTRPYRPDDLDDCLRWTHRQGERADCQMIWSRQRMSVQLDHPQARTWVAERDGRRSGFASGYLIDWSGAQTVRVGFIELCAAEGGVAAHAGLLVAAGRALAAEGAQMIVMMSVGCQPHAALLAAGFTPMDPHVQSLALLGELATALPVPSRLHCAFT